MTNLRNAYAGENQARMRYKSFAERAERNGLTNVARLFNAVSLAEKIHAGNHFRNIVSKGGFQTVAAAIFGASSTSGDLQVGIGGETFEIKEMYPVYRAVAQFQEEKAAETTFTWALEAEKTHLSLCNRAKQAVDQEKDAAIARIQVCSTCGYTA